MVIPSITVCRVLVSEGSVGSLKKAEKELLRLAELTEVQHNYSKLTEIICLLAIASYQQGKVEAAQEYLERALMLAHPGGIILPFVEWHPSLAKVMLKMLPERSDWLIKRIRDILTGQSAIDIIAQPQIDALTNREHDVLECLANRLYDKEIADELGISAETVKTHVKRIRGKLGVSNRRDAVAKARELGVL